MGEDLTLNDAAPRLGVANGNVVRQYIKRGVLLATKRGRDWFVTQESINTYLATKPNNGNHNRKYIVPQKVILPRYTPLPTTQTTVHIRYARSFALCWVTFGSLEPSVSASMHRCEEQGSNPSEKPSPRTARAS